MKVLLVGGGGREHALAWRLAKDDPSIEIVAAPGNPGIAQHATCVAVAANDVEGLLKLAREHRPDFTLVGPEAPLAAGLVDRFRTEGFPIFGPTKAAAEIETSKAFAKDVMRAAGVPTARAIVCTDVRKAKAAAREFGPKVVIKASGLAAGKGVIVALSFTEADRAIEDMLVGNTFGDAGREVLVEEFMTGEELSVLALTDGVTALPLVPAQDHKRLLEGDRGPNTGGMGAYAPVALATEELMERVQREILKPTLAEMTARGRPFTGVLYAGLMLTPTGPRVVEFNCRFGDPETQAVLLATRLSLRFADIIGAIARGERIPAAARVHADGAAVTTVLAASGYPEKPWSGAAISIPEGLGEHVTVFHAGTKLDGTGRLVVSGGRVLAVTGRGRDVAEARKRSTDAAARIAFSGRQYRSDIGWRELSRRAGTS
jgi:phosphoribosylamine--glycine ligase